jgi:hypothetical protein
MMMKKIALMAAVLTGLVGVASAATIYDATPDNTILVDNGAGGSGGITLTGAPGNLVVTNVNGSFNMGGFVSADTINILNTLNLTDTDTVTMSLTVDSITGTWRANGVQFGMSGNTTFLSGTNNFAFGVEAGNNGSDVLLTGSWLANGNLGFDAQEASVLDGFSMEIVAGASGYTFTLSDVIIANSTVAGISNGDTSATVSGTFAAGDFVNYFGSGHLYYTAQRFNTSAATDPLVSTISVASIAVDVQDDPILELAPDTLSFDLFAPDTSTNGTITASYFPGANSQSDIEIISLVASNGFSASMVSTTLGLANTDEDITVTFTNSVGLSNFLDATNSTLVVTWTEVGSGLTNTFEAALDVTYIPESPSTPEHGLVLFEAATDNTTLYNNSVAGDASNVMLTGATPDLLLAVDGGDFYVGGLFSTDTISNLLGSAVTDEDTVMISLTVDSVTHTDTSELRSRGIEFGMQAENPDESFTVRVGGAGNGTPILITGTTNAAITSAVFRATAASVEDGFSSTIVANEAGFTIYFEGLEAVDGAGSDYVWPVSGTFEEGYFANAFGGGHYFASVQKRLAGTTTVDISEATLSVGAAAPAVFVATSVFNGNFVVQFTGTVGRQYDIKSTDDLVFGVWKTVTNITSLPESPMEVSWPATNPAAFYRVLAP